MSTRHIGAEAVAAKGRLRANQWLLLRRISQFGILALFLLGPWFGLWIVKGNLTASLTLDTLPLTDPFVLSQVLASGHWPETAALVGALIVIACYGLVGGRSYCAWVCPMNLVTDAAGWLRGRLGLQGGSRPPRAIRYGLLLMALGLAAFTGSLVWELFNPVTLLHRGLVYGMGLAWFVVLAVFLYDLLISRQGWCGHLCPMGACYSLIGRVSLLRISAVKRGQCNDCMDCFAVCPEPQVIRPALKGGPASSPLILSANCTNCGRCIDVCSKDVFRFSTRFSQQTSHSIHQRGEALS